MLLDIDSINGYWVILVKVDDHLDLYYQGTKQGVKIEIGSSLYINFGKLDKVNFFVSGGPFHFDDIFERGFYQRQSLSKKTGITANK